MSQSKLGSLVEALTNTFVGLLIAFVAQTFILWCLHVTISHQQNLILVAFMTVVSVIRSYYMRRIFNSEFWKGIKK